MKSRTLSAHGESWLLARPFRISNAVYETSDVIVAELFENGFVGRGEAAGVDYLGETPATMLVQLEGLADVHEIDRESLANELPAGGARNALDCALWDLEAKRSGKRVWTLLRDNPSAQRQTYVTVGIDTPAAMARQAAILGKGALIKLKLGDADDLERLRAVRQANPTANIIVDANGAWSYDEYRVLLPTLVGAGISLIEQPLEPGDGSLNGNERPIPVFADESCQTSGSLQSLCGAFDGVNIKLDKAGGLTESLAMVTEARRLNFRLMVGCMQATSLGIAPALLVARHCEFVDLDWHFMNRSDRPYGLAGSPPLLEPFSDALWG